MSVSFPVALMLEGRACLVVGSGSEALRRIRALSAVGAEVTLVSTKPESQLEAECLNSGIQLLERDYASTDMSGKWLAVLCDRDAELAARMGHDAEQQQVFFCAVDQPETNSFAHVGLARSGPLFVAVGTDGKAPALARRLKHEFERILNEPNLREFVERAVRLREQTEPPHRASVLNRLVNKLRLSGGFVIDD